MQRVRQLVSLSLTKGSSCWSGVRRYSLFGAGPPCSAECRPRAAGSKVFELYGDVAFPQQSGGGARPAAWRIFPIVVYVKSSWNFEASCMDFSLQDFAGFPAI